jgi:hypothetical protein
MTYTPVDVKRAGNLGFDMHMDNSVECFIAPKGPVLLVSARWVVVLHRARRKMRKFHCIPSAIVLTGFCLRTGCRRSLF